MKLKQVYRRLLKQYGPQHWWPAESEFEVMVGAVLTQNTAWINVEKAMDNLRANHSLTPEAILASTPSKLASWLKPSGYFNTKAKRLRTFCEWYLAHGGFHRLNTWSTEQLRSALLSINGIGPETADDILLYAFHRPVFVIDAYTRRLFSRLGMVNGDESYEELRCLVENRLIADVQLFNEYHALIVRHAKNVCKKRPTCSECALMDMCQALIDSQK